jgi:type VI secretion system protein ImpA
MAEPSTIDIEALLEPISPDRPAGEDLTYEAGYGELREARRADDVTSLGDWKPKDKPKVSEWDRVVSLGSEYLARKTKDLQIAAWMTEALVHLNGFAGLRDGFRLLAGLQERFWEVLFPEIEDGDLEPRAGPFEFLNQDKLLPFLIRSVPLTAGLGEEDYSFLRYQESRATDNAVRKDPEQLSVLTAEGKITSEQFDKAVAQTSLAFYEGLVEDLRECIAAFTALDRDNDRRFGREAPSLVGLRKALDDCRNLIESILQDKRAQQPDADGPPEEPEPAEEESTVAEEETWAAAEPGDDVEEAEVAEPVAPVRRRPSARPSGGPITDVEDARRRIVEAAAYLRQNEPGSPVPHLVVRALRMAEVYGLPRPLEASELPSPSSEVRQTLRRRAAEEQWADLLEEAEGAIGRPEGRAWLDAQRLADVALMATGASAAAEGARGMLRALLADFPDLPQAEMSDGTPTANAETRAWLEAEILPATGRASGFEEPYAEEPTPLESITSPEQVAADDAPPDPWDQAREAVGAGRVAEGLLILQQAMGRAATGRERFLRALQLTELCLMARQDRLALPLAEDLARLIDEFRLEQWESPELIARAWGALYHCLRGTGDGAADRLPPVFARLCRLDISRALRVGGDGAG